nr:MAG TPA: hypothetical protein [Caudoviricetes sp.]
MMYLNHRYLSYRSYYHSPFIAMGVDQCADGDNNVSYYYILIIYSYPNTKDIGKYIYLRHFIFTNYV